MQWLRMGMSINRIAELMNVTRATIDGNLFLIRRKLGVHSNQEAVVAYRLEIEALYHESRTSQMDDFE